MLKAIGSICIIIGCAGVGICLREKIYDTLEQMRIIIQILKNISNEVLYHKNTLEDAVKIVAVKQKEPFDDLLLHVTGRYQDNSGISFATAWQEAFEEYKDELYLSKETTEQLMTLFSATQRNPQLQYEKIRETIGRIEDELHVMEKNSSNQGRMYVCLGVLTGMISTIILI